MSLTPGRMAVVTGAASGLARGIAVALAAAGYRVAFTYRPGGTPPDDTLAAVRVHDPEALALAADGTMPEAAELVIRTVTQRRGPPEVLVHALGPIVVRRFATSTLADYHAMLDGNLQSAVTTAWAVLPGMRERGFGRLVFFGMNGSSVTEPGLGMSLYGAAKAAVVTFARALALEEARHGITVNVVEPGDIRNKSLDRKAAERIPANNPSGRAGSWEDVAYAVKCLVSDEASFMNGVVIGVNGGLTGPFELPLGEST